jgi:hypothetical protein
MNILYLDPIVHSATSMNYKYYDGVVDELIKREDCRVYHHRDTIDDFSKVSPNFDAVIFGLGWFNHGYFGEIKNMNIPSVCILFKPQNELSEKLSFCKNNNISKILTPVPICKKIEELTGISTSLFPYGFCPETFYNRGDILKEIDIGFSGALHESKHYPPGAFPVDNIRTKMGEALSSMSDVKVYWKSRDDRPSRIPNYEDYAMKINGSKMWAATQAAYGDITPRYFEVFASGTLLVCQKVPKEYRDIFVPGVNCIEFESDMTDFEQKILKYKEDDELRGQIVSQALSESIEHTWEKRAEDLIRVIRGMI